MTGGREMQAMVFAAGLGTRLKPLTDRMPKALVPVGGEPLLRRVLRRLDSAGAGRVVVNVHHFAGQIADYLSANANFGMDIRVSDESARLLDTGGGLRKAAPLFSPDAPVLIHNVDIMSNVDLAGLYAAGLHSDALLLVSGRKTKRYLLFDSGMRLVGWTNVSTGQIRSPYPHPDVRSCRKYAFSGIHILSHEVFGLFRRKHYEGKFSIMDFYLDVAAEYPIYGVVPESLDLIDVGKPESLALVEERIRTGSLQP